MPHCCPVTEYFFLLESLAFHLLKKVDLDAFTVSPTLSVPPGENAKVLPSYRKAALINHQQLN